MIPTSNRRRPWVVRDSRGANAVLPAGNSKRCEAPEPAGWLHLLGAALRAAAGNPMAGFIGFEIAILAFLLLLLRL